MGVHEFMGISVGLRFDESEGVEGRSVREIVAIQGPDAEARLRAWPMTPGGLHLDEAGDCTANTYVPIVAIRVRDAEISCLEMSALEPITLDELRHAFDETRGQLREVGVTQEPRLLLRWCVS